MMQTGIRLFGQGCAEDLLKLYGRPATSRELYDFMIQNHGELISLDMLQNGLRKGVKWHVFKVIADEPAHSRFGRHAKIQRFVLA